MAGFSSDTCNVMFCVNQSLSTPIRQTVPQIITIKFGCHMLKLCSCCARCVLIASLIICQNSWKKRFINWIYHYYYYYYASKVLPDYLEDLLRIITNHFSYSPKAKNALFSFPRRDKTGYILSPGQTRWLTREASIKRVISECDPLVAYFKYLMLTDKCNTNRFILQYLWKQ